MPGGAWPSARFQTRAASAADQCFPRLCRERYRGGSMSRAAPPSLALLVLSWLTLLPPAALGQEAGSSSLRSRLAALQAKKPDSLRGTR